MPCYEVRSQHLPHAPATGYLVLRITQTTDPVQSSWTLLSFPRVLHRVEAYFSSSSFPIVQGRPNPEYLVGTDLVQEQCRGFVQLGEDLV